MKKIRTPLDSDQYNTQKGFELIIDLMQKHPEIEPTLWVGAIFSVLVNGYKKCGFSYEEFCNEIHEVLLHYKDQWDLWDN